MSWSEYGSNLTREEIAGCEAHTPSAQQAQDQYDAAKAAAIAVIDSGVVGDPQTHKFNLTLSGHANPGHEPATGYANDCVTVSLSQAAAPPA